jgi:hypothetical protein
MAGMKQLLFTLMLIFVVVSPVLAACQDVSSPSQQVAAENVGAATQGPMQSPAEVVISQDTKVQLRLMESVSSASNHKGDVVQLEVVSDVVTDGTVVIPAGTTAVAKITEARARSAKHSGWIDFSTPELMVGGRKIRLALDTAKDRSDERTEVFGTIGWMILGAPLVAIQIPFAVVSGVLYAIFGDGTEMHPEDKEHEQGEMFTYYTRRNARVKMATMRVSTP